MLGFVISIDNENGIFFMWGKFFDQKLMITKKTFPFVHNTVQESDLASINNTKKRLGLYIDKYHVISLIDSLVGMI